MIELSLSVIAWLSVVVVQAVVHYVVLGTRRGVGNPTSTSSDDVADEGDCSKSLSTVETTIIDHDLDSSFVMKLPSTPKLGEKELFELPDHEEEPHPLLEFLLDQTGTELFRVSAVQ